MPVGQLGSSWRESVFLDRPASGERSFHLSTLRVTEGSDSNQHTRGQFNMGDGPRGWSSCTPRVLRISASTPELKLRFASVLIDRPRAIGVLGGAFLQSETSGGECQMAIEEAARTDPAEFTAEVRNEDGAMVVSLWGELDLFTAGKLREVLVLPEVLNAAAVRVDLTKVDFLGSTCVGVLVSACKRVKASGGTFSVTCGQNESRRILEVQGLLDYLHVEGPA